jgi:hypothetical protein
VYEQDAVSFDDDDLIIAGIIDELKTKGVRVCSIIGDNLPASASSLAHLSKKSLLKGVDRDVDRIKYSPCICHFIQLVIGDVATRIHDI